MRRVIIAFTILGTLAAYLIFRLWPALGHFSWVVIFLLGLIFIYPFSWQKKVSSRFASLIRGLIFIDMGFLSFVFGLVVLRDLIFLPLCWWRALHDVETFVFGFSGTMMLLALAVALHLIGFIWAIVGARVREVVVVFENLPQELDGVRIVQISDLHVGATIGISYVADVVKKTNLLDVDFITFTGDIADGTFEEYRSVISPLKTLKSKHGSFYVPGNHEYYWNGPKWLQEFDSLGLHVLLNSHHVVKIRNHSMLIAGVLDPAASLAEPGAKPDVKQALQNAPPVDFKILLAHQPGIATQAEAAGFDLQLSGHTHGGQFFPWTLIIRQFHKYHRGLDRLGRMCIYVNPGTGWWGPPIRLGTTPEITLLKLKAVRK